MKLKAYWKQTSHGDCKQKPTNKRKKPHNRRKTQGINKQTNKHIYKIKTNKRTSSIGYEKTVFSYQQSVAPGPPNQTYQPTSSAAQNAQTPGAAAAQLETGQRWPGRTASRTVKAPRTSS